MKALTKIFILSFIFLFAPSVKADVVWPSLYIAKGMTSLHVILSGLAVESIFVKYFAKLIWKKAILISLLMNIVTTILGIVLIPLSGLFSELVFDAVFHVYDKFGIGTFHWSHWLVSYLSVILLNTFIEGICVKIALNLRIKQTFMWLLAANAISVLICFIAFMI